jgi:hypothetical protein
VSEKINNLILILFINKPNRIPIFIQIQFA